MRTIQNKARFTGFLIAFFYFSAGDCSGSGKKENLKPDAKNEGYWDVSPETKQSGKKQKVEEPKDWFYLQYSAKASSSSVERALQSLMQTTCREAAKIQGKAEVSKKMFLNSLSEAGLCSSEDEEANCASFASENSSSVKTFNILNCEATGIGPEPEKKPGSWEECICILYANYPGGKAAIVQKAKAGK